MRTVHKYPFNVEDRFTLNLPVGFQPVLVDVQAGMDCLWCEIDTDCEIEPFQFAVTGTGHPVPVEADHACTWQHGSFVWHLWRLP